MNYIYGITTITQIQGPTTQHILYSPEFKKKFKAIPKLIKEIWQQANILFPPHTPPSPITNTNASHNIPTTRTGQHDATIGIQVQVIIDTKTLTTKINEKPKLSKDPTYVNGMHHMPPWNG